LKRPNFKKANIWLGVCLLLLTLLGAPVKNAAAEDGPTLTPTSPLIADPLIDEMVKRVNAAELYNLVGGLSGEWPVNLAGAPYTFDTRYSYSGAPITQAALYAHDFLQSLGLATTYDDYSLNNTPLRNVIAQQTGLTQPEKILLLTAHLDSTSYLNGNPYSLAPGADDNASGAAAVFHIAKILNRYDFGCSLRYALFTGEEQGMVGSQTYASEVRALNEDIQAVLNLDMLGYNTPGSAPKLELHTRQANAADLAIAQLFQGVVSAYNLPLTPFILQDNESFSDHASFWKRGYPAILAIEDWNDHTPFYHQTGDRLATLDFAYYVPFVKASLATFAHMGCLLEGRLSGQVLDSLSGQPIEGATVAAWQDGAQIRAVTSKAGGSYQLPLQPGDYLIKFTALDHLEADYPATNIQDAQTATIQAALAPCVFVKGLSIGASQILVPTDASVSFTATYEGGEPPISFVWDFGDGAIADSPIVSHAFSGPGAYLVQLEANNACEVPARSAAVIFVDVMRTFLPLAVNTTN
jgi:hypothetical protein